MSQQTQGEDFPNYLSLSGVKLSAIAAGIKYPSRLDFTLFEFEPNTEMAATFTKNKFCAAPVVIAKEHLTSRSLSEPSYWLINTGYANAGTGQQGYENAKKICKSLAEQVGVDENQVLPFSTGVIGEHLPLETMQQQVPKLCQALASPADDNQLWQEVATGIMTTDTRPKGAFVSFEWKGKSFHIGGITKGAGMIKPNMATMLAFIVTDLSVSQPVLQSSLLEAVEQSFNSITVDGDTSTNDACLLAATAKSEVEHIDGSNQGLVDVFKEALNKVCLSLAKSIVKDGEGATKCVEIRVTGAANQKAARVIAESIAHSPLVKTAFFAEDPNWGRILAAVGYAPVDELDINKVDLYFDDLLILEDGGLAPGYQEKKAAEIMKQAEFTVRVDLKSGEVSSALWTTDFSYDYVKINAEYRS